MEWEWELESELEWEWELEWELGLEWELEWELGLELGPRPGLVRHHDWPLVTISGSSCAAARAAAAREWLGAPPGSGPRGACPRGASAVITRSRGCSRRSTRATPQQPPCAGRAALPSRG